MWEVRAAPGALPDLLAWVERQLANDPGPGPDNDGGRADVYVAADDRIVVILRSPAGAPRPARLPEPPAELLARPPHQWPFAFHGHWGPPSPATRPEDK
ncbi:hypothetical protein GXP74_12785 [Streptacidiphilus sp. P02-A3a]|nr:hypothetical protein GXP74_12785 [Streptacidiphilus sp. P02-A3a]